MSAGLADAIKAWAGIYSPILEPKVSQKADREISAASSDIAAQCLSTRPTQDGTCPDVCEPKGRARCVVSSEIATKTKAYEVGAEINNSFTYDLYKAVNVFVSSPEDGFESDARLFWSADTKTAVIPFRVGRIRTRAVIEREAAQYFDHITKSRAILKLLFVDANKIVLAGHSEGGVVAEALALKFVQMAAKDEYKNYMPQMLAKMYVVNSGAHVWMNTADVAALTAALPGRIASFVTGQQQQGANPTTIDKFVVGTKEQDGPESGLDFLPKSLLPRATLEVEWPSRAALIVSFTQGEIKFSENNGGPAETNPFLSLHMWATYEAAMRPLLTGQTGGSDPDTDADAETAVYREDASADFLSGGAALDDLSAKIRTNRMIECVKRSANALTCARPLDVDGEVLFVKVAEIKKGLKTDPVAVDAANSYVVRKMDPLGAWSVGLVGLNECTISMNDAETATATVTGPAAAKSTAAALAFPVVQGEDLPGENVESFKTIADKVRSFMRTFIEVASENGMNHNDMHLGNVMNQKSGLRLIDYGRAHFSNRSYKSLDDTVRRVVEQILKTGSKTDDVRRNGLRNKWNPFRNDEGDAFDQLYWTSDLITLSMQLYSGIRKGRMSAFQRTKAMFLRRVKKADNDYFLCNYADATDLYAKLESMNAALNVLKPGLALYAIVLMHIKTYYGEDEDNANYEYVYPNFVMTSNGGDVLIAMFEDGSLIKKYGRVLEYAFGAAGLLDSASPSLALLQKVADEQGGGGLEWPDCDYHDDCEEVGDPEVAADMQSAPVQGLFPGSLIEAASYGFRRFSMPADTEDLPTVDTEYLPTAEEMSPLEFARQMIENEAPYRPLVAPVSGGASATGYVASAVLAGVVVLMSVVNGFRGD